MGKGSSAPRPPDPYQTARAESQFNRLDTYSPSGGGVRYGYTDAQGNFVQGMPGRGQRSAVSYQESPWERSIREMLQPASTGLIGRMIRDNVTNLPDAPRVRDRPDVARDIFDRNMSLMAPAIEQGQSRLLTNLQARGLPVGGAAFNDAYGAQTRETQGMIARLAQDANVAAGQEQSREFGLGQAQRQQAISEIVAAMGGSYNPPNNVPSGNAAGIPIGQMIGDNYQQRLAAWREGDAQRTAAMNTLGNLAGSALMKCSAGLKERLGDLDVEAAAEAVASLPLHAWRYRDFEDGAVHVGPMAEDFHAATGLGDGRTIHVIDMVGVLAGALQAAMARIAALEARP